MRSGSFGQEDTGYGIRRATISRLAGNGIPHQDQAPLLRRNGTWLATKRLEKGRFSWQSASEPGQHRIKLQPEALQLLIDGVDLRGAAFKPWYERPE
jgi:hypothetical protein